MCLRVVQVRCGQRAGVFAARCEERGGIQDKNATVVVILLGGEGWCVHGDVWNSVREEC